MGPRETTGSCLASPGPVWVPRPVFATFCLETPFVDTIVYSVVVFEWRWRGLIGVAGSWLGQVSSSLIYGWGWRDLIRTIPSVLSYLVVHRQPQSSSDQYSANIDHLFTLTAPQNRRAGRGGIRVVGVGNRTIYTPSPHTPTHPHSEVTIPR
jgi:hypothetical protein